MVTSASAITATAIAVTGTTVYVASHPTGVGAGQVTRLTNTSGTTFAAVATLQPIGVSRPTALAVHANRLYVVNSGDNTVAQYNDTNHVGSIPLGAGSDPTAIAIDTVGNRAYVTNRGTNTVKVFTTDNNLGAADDTALPDITNLGLGTGPTGVIYNNRLYVSTENGYLVEINTTANANTVVQSAQLPDHGRGIAISPTTNTVYITGSDNVPTPPGTGSGTNDDLYVIVV